MKHLLSLIAASLLAFSFASAQQPQTPEEQEKQLMEYIDKEVERLSNTLKMEYWQEFNTRTAASYTRAWLALTEEYNPLHSSG